ncbi:Ig-like domain-containing protein [Coleofasciculus sp. F4-SAH-05]|uniref:Ig-like domain-containing protein n=1 Tax=Coleofasciculus sp. F4-SAH-05 TaxID=3069525 RepID=UPI003301808A
MGKTDNDDNTLIVPFNVLTPNLEVSSAQVTDINGNPVTSVAADETVTLSWTVLNSSTTATAGANWYDRIYISQDTTLDSSDVRLVNYFINSHTPLVAGNNYTVTSNPIIPEIATGDYFFLFKADGSENQQEADETDNITAIPIQIDAPNLEVSAAQVTDINGNPVTSVAADETVTLSWTVFNSSTTATAGADWFDRVYISQDETLDSSDVRLVNQFINSHTPLVAGNNYTVTSNPIIPEIPTGDYFFLFKADGSEQQQEADETDNIRAIPIQIDAPNLEVSSAQVTDANGNPVTSVAVDETVTLSWTVFNSSTTATAGADWWDRVYISQDTTLDSSDVQLLNRNTASLTPLAATDNYTVTNNVTIPEIATGDYFFLFKADGSEQQQETDETDNITAIPIQISPPADLVVNSVTAPATANFGDTITIDLQVANSGIGTATRTWRDRVFLSSDNNISTNDTILLTELAPTTLASGQTYNQSVSVTLPLNNSITAGTYFLLAQTDNLEQQFETNETNNVNSTQIELTIPPTPDLIVSDISAPTTAVSGQGIEVSWTLTNQGDGTASGTWTDQVFLSDNLTVGNDQFLDSFTFTGTLAPGESITRTQIVTAPIDLAGDHYFVVDTDTNNQIFEFTEDNNNSAIDDQAISLELSPTPNLQVTSVTAPTTAFSSQETVVAWIVTNNGTAATSTPIWTDQVWLSLDQILDNNDTLLGSTTNPSFLNVGDSYSNSNSLTVTLPQGIDGDYFFIVQTDAGNQVFELNNETDNNGVSQILTINDINESPTITSNSTPNLDENTTLVTTITATDPDGDIPTFSITGGSDSSFFTLDANTGELSFNNPANFETPLDADGNNSYDVEITADDGNGGSDSQSLTITVNDINETPTANNDNFSTDEATAFTTANVLDNDNDPDSSDTISVSNLDTTTTLGLVINNGDGTFHYDPNGQFESLAVGETAIDNFSYTIDDGNSKTDNATVNITLNGVNDIPIANDDNFTINEDSAFTTANFLDNDSDIDSNDTLTFASIDTSNTLGTVTLNANNTLTYNPNHAFAFLTQGETATDSFIYTLDDGNGGIDTATVTVTINGSNDAPTLSTINKSGDEDTTISFTATDFTAVFNDPEGDSLSQINILSLPANGILRLNNTAVTPGETIAAINLDNLSFTPDANFNGTTSFIWNASDGFLFAAGAAVNLAIASVNDNPVSGDDQATTLENTAVTIDVLANDSDPVEGDSVFIDSFDAISLLGSTISQDDNGTPNDLTDDQLVYI